MYGTLSSAFLRDTTVFLDDLCSPAAAGQLYAILDVCGGDEILAKVLHMPPEHSCCLFQGKALQEYWAVAPYLVTVDASILAWLLTTVWDEPWGILAIAECGRAKLYRHFRQFLLVKDSEGDRTLLFRFYDPRVFAAFLPTCTAKELRKVFGPVDYFGVKTSQRGLITLARSLV